MKNVLTHIYSIVPAEFKYITVVKKVQSFNNFTKTIIDVINFDAVNVLEILKGFGGVHDENLKSEVEKHDVDKSNGNLKENIREFNVNKMNKHLE